MVHNKQGIDMLHGRIWTKVLRFALPVAATGILEQLFNASGIMIVGNFSQSDGTAAVAAVGSNAPVTGLILNLFIGIALGANVVIANAIGRGSREAVRNAVHTSIVTALIGGVIVAITGQSAEINQGVARLTGEKETEASREERYEAQGAGDQGVMFGYATDETDVLMPLPIYLAHRLAFRLTEVRKSGEVPHLRPDGKTQVTIEYDENDKPLRVDTVLISTQHDPEASREWLAAQLKEHVIDPVLDEVLGDGVKHDDYRQLVNPTGSFVLGGPAADAGLTGRKIIVDTYGGAAHHGGGAFSGKDPSKVDRSAAYATRWVAKNIVAAGLAHKVEIQIAYAIGVADPVSVNVETFGTEQGVTRGQIAAAVRKVFDLRPAPSSTSWI